MLTYLYSRLLADEVKPPVIPRIPSLPSISSGTQGGGGQAVRNYILNEFGSRFMLGFLSIAAITSVIFIIVGGIQMYLAMGNEEALGKAKKTVIWAIAGLVICILSVAIVQIISKISV